MKNKLLLSSLTLGATSVLLASPIIAAVHQSNDSEAKVNFTAPEDEPEILDPETLEPQTPEDGTETNNKGPLSLDFVSNIDFGSHEIPVVAEEYEAVTEKPFIQVTDRRGTGQGWSVSAQASNFEQNGQNTLNNSTITFSNGESASPLDGIEAPVVQENIELTTGGESAPVVEAAARGENESISNAQGLGTWVIRWLKGEGNDTNEKVKLSVPQGQASAGEHTSTITWTLYDGPGNN